MKAVTWRQWLAGSAIALALIALTAGAAGRVAQATTSDDVQWSGRIIVTFTPAQVARPEWENQYQTLLTGLTTRLRSRDAGLTTGRQLSAGGGEQLTFDMTGRGGLAQFKQAIFEDSQPLGGLVGGPADMTLQGDVNEGQDLQLVLESNISTGYAWQLAGFDPSLVHITTSSLEPKGNLLGAPMRQKIGLHADKAGRASLLLQYRRPWALDESTSRSFSLSAPQLTDVADTSDPRPVQTVAPAQDHQAPARLVPQAPNVPSAWDWVSQGKVSPVRNQGGCGSCWAFSTAAAYESNLLFNNNVTDPNADNSSEQFLISCNQSGWSCGGGWFAHDYNVSTLGKLQTNAGGVDETAFPYAANNGACTKAYTHAFKLTNWYYVGASNGVPATDAIKNAIYTYGPVSAAVCAGNAFDNYRGGVFGTDEKSTCGGGVNHAILLVGWSDVDGAWLMKNSWSTGWGESGYMRIKYGVSNIGYAANYVVGNNVPPPACYSVGTGVNQSGYGTVTANVAPNCNSGTGYNAGTSLSLTAKPSSGYQFSGWSGSVSGSSNPLALTVDGDKTVTANFTPVNRLANPGFETDANLDNRPDRWTSTLKFLRSTASVHGGTYSGRLYAKDNSNPTIQQTVKSIKGGDAYQFSGWVNIPATADTFTFKFVLKWKNSLGNLLRTDTLASYTAATAGWVQATASPTAPTGATSVNVQMVATSLNATIYVDDLYFGK